MSTRDDLTTRIEYQPGLDGLRAFAVALVLLFHSDLGWLPGGFLGVSVFFTLSGFLITSLLVKEIEARGRVGLLTFWERRFRRLAPAALVTIVGVCVAAVRLCSPIEQSRLRMDALAAVFYVGNWRSIVAQLSYEEIFSTESPLIHLWSLAIEEQLYLVVPLVAATVAMTGRGRRTLGAVALVLAVCSTAVSILFTGGDRLYYGTDTRAAELLIGVAAAALVGPRLLSGDVRVSRLTSWLAPTALVAVVAISRVSSTNSAWVYEGYLPAFAVLSLVCVLGAVVPGPMRTILSIEPLVRIGRLSYGLYLFHWPIFTWFDAERLGFAGVALFAVRVAITACVTWISFVLIETPIRKRRVLKSRQSFVIALALAMVVAVVVPLSLLDSVSGRPTTDVRVLSTLPAASSGGIVSSNEPSNPSMQPLRVLVIGDSTAENVARALATVESFGVVSAGVLGCPLVAAVEVFDRPRASQETAYCPDNVDIVRSRASDIDLLFVVGGVSNQWAYRNPSGTVVEPGSLRYQQEYDELMNDLLVALAPVGVPIVVLDNPSTRPDDAVLGDEASAHAAWRAQIQRWDRAWVSVTRISIDEALAPADSAQGLSQRPDGVHLEESFAAELARSVLGPGLNERYREMVVELGESGCRSVIDGKAELVLESCRSR